MIGLVALMTAVWALLIPNGLPWMGLGLVMLAFAGVLWQRMKSTRSMSEIIDDVDAEPARVLAVSTRVAASRSKAAS